MLTITTEDVRNAYGPNWQVCRFLEKCPEGVIGGHNYWDLLTAGLKRFSVEDVICFLSNTEMFELVEFCFQNLVGLVDLLDQYEEEYENDLAEIFESLLQTSINLSLFYKEINRLVEQYPILYDHLVDALQDDINETIDEIVWDIEVDFHNTYHEIEEQEVREVFRKVYGQSIDSYLIHDFLTLGDGAYHFDNIVYDLKEYHFDDLLEQLENEYEEI